jgi:thymidylate synthase (FAD)
MDKIEVGVIAEHGNALETMGFLARLTQRGHNIKSLQDIKDMLGKPVSNPFAEALMKMELHGTIKRFTPITIAIVGASRRFLAQARTNQVGFTYVSASLQYSDYSNTADFVVPYEIIAADHNATSTFAQLGVLGVVDKEDKLTKLYLDSCKASMDVYRQLAEDTDNDTAGYAAPQGLRNILIMQGNHEAWLHFLKLRTCNRNTPETQYVAFRIWEELLKTDGGEQMFKYAGPDCMYGICREGKMCCGKPMKKFTRAAIEADKTIPRIIIEDRWPLIAKGGNV